MIVGQEVLIELEWDAGPFQIPFTPVVEHKTVRLSMLDAF